MRGNLNTQFWLDNDTKHLENAFNHNFYKLVYKNYLYKAFSKERSGSVVECLTRDREVHQLEANRCHCVVVLEQDTFILA